MSRGRYSLTRLEVNIEDVKGEWTDEEIRDYVKKLLEKALYQYLQLQAVNVIK